jgi:peptide chain release factor 1
MLEKLQSIEERYEELNRLLADPGVVTDPERLRQYAQEQADLAEVVQTYRRYKEVRKKLEETRGMMDDGLDDELREMAEQEIAQLESSQEELYRRLKLLLLPRDPNDERDVIMEIRAGTGGEEAALFAADLYRMYSRYAEAHNWKVELLSSHETGIGGFKEIICAVRGRGAYSRLKYESGVHRVQRVPVTEASGRIHTSTATVAVLPEMDEVEVQIDPDDLRIDVYRSAGAGGQNVQKNATAVRITHLPTGIVVACQDERSQYQNKESAMKILRARLYAMEEQKRLGELGEKRRAQVGTGERSEKIRTYNFPQNRVTDHRINITSYRLESILGGNIDEFIDALATTEQAEKLQALAMER